MSNKILILSPVYNDWPSARKLLQIVDQLPSSRENQIHFYFVDDGSVEGELGNIQDLKLQAIQHLSVIRLARNLGHQRAIAVGLSELSKLNFDSVIIMDSDGEDQPSDIPSMIQKHFIDVGRPVVFARRSKRSEPFAFRIGYQLYKMTYRILTGRSIFFGNFSIISSANVKRLTLHSELWNHYAATVLKSRLPWCSIDTVRGKRFFGASKMGGLGSLLLHGLNAIAVQADELGVRSIIATLLVMVLGIFGFLVILAVRLFTNSAIPGWASVFGFSFVNLIFQAFMGSMLLAFFILNNRTNTVHTPLQHAHQFVSEIQEVF